EADFYPEFIELAGKVNQAQPGFCVSRIERALNDVGRAVRGSRVLVLGASYKAGIGDIRESPALKIIRLLAERGAEVSYHDRHGAALEGLGRRSVELEGALGDAALVAIVTAHPELDYAAVAAKAARVIDFRGVTREIDAENVVRL